MAFGFHGAILHVYLDTQTTSVEYPEDNFYRIYGGGGLLGTYFLLRDTAPKIDPLSPENILVFSNSVVAGYPAAGLVRYVVTTKSPLSNGIGETRSEGPWAVSLKKSGYDAIVLHGRADHPVSMIIEDGAVRFVDASHLWGKTVGQTTDAITDAYDRATDVATIGPAGEQMVRYASIVSSRTHQAQRHGVGAVMGSKNLKAIILIGGSLPPMADPERVATLNARFAADMKKNTLSMWQKDLPGFAVWVHTHGLDAALNTENYRTASFEYLENYKASTWMPYFQSTAKCPGCPNDCIKIYHNHEADLDIRAGGLHQEVSGTMGPNIGTQHPRAVMRYNNLCNQYGLDPVSLGFTLSFAMEANEQGLIPKHMLDGIALRFGNTDATLAMIELIVKRSGFGNILAEGSQRAAERIGNGSERYAMHVKGVELVPFEPRSQSNLALGYATAPIGPRYDICEHDWDFDTQVGWDHSLDYSRTLGIIERIPMEYLGPKKVRNYKALHTIWSAADALAFCIFAIAPTRVLSLQMMTDMLAAVTGWETSSHELLRFGERRTHLMQLYNRREGIGANTDTLPKRFFTEPIDSGDKAGVFLDKVAFDAEIALYYEMMGWDESGTPRPGTLYEFHLEWAIEHLPATPKPLIPVALGIAPDAPAPTDEARELPVEASVSVDHPVILTVDTPTSPIQEQSTVGDSPAVRAEHSDSAPAVHQESVTDAQPVSTPQSIATSSVGSTSPIAVPIPPSEIHTSLTDDTSATITQTRATSDALDGAGVASTTFEQPQAVVAETNTDDVSRDQSLHTSAHTEAVTDGSSPTVNTTAQAPKKKPNTTGKRGNRTPITSTLLESLLTAPNELDEHTEEGDSLPVFEGAASKLDDVPTSALTPELHDQHIAAIQSQKTLDTSNMTQAVPAVDTQQAADSLLINDQAVPQPQTRLPAPAVKQYIPKPNTDTALIVPQPSPDDFVFPTEPAKPTAEQSASVDAHKPVPRTSIVKRLSIEELLKAELPQPNKPSREDT